MDIEKIKELAKTVTESLDLSKFKGDIVGVKVVENEFGNIEAGGIGVQNNIVKDVPLTVSDKDIKSSLTFCHYPKQMTSFKTKITDMEIDYGGNSNVITYASLTDAPKEVPLMATSSPSSWDTYKEMSDNYKQQYDVAEYLMLKLGIKS